jgi:hypothetical protein
MDADSTWDFCRCLRPNRPQLRGDMGLPNQLEVEGPAPVMELEIVEDSGLLSALTEHSAERINFKDLQSRFMDVCWHT